MGASGCAAPPLPSSFVLEEGKDRCWKRGAKRRCGMRHRASCCSPLPDGRRRASSCWRGGVLQGCTPPGGLSLHCTRFPVVLALSHSQPCHGWAMARSRTTAERTRGGRSRDPHPGCISCSGYGLHRNSKVWLRARGWQEPAWTQGPVPDWFGRQWEPVGHLRPGPLTRFGVRPPPSGGTVPWPGSLQAAHCLGDACPHWDGTGLRLPRCRARPSSPGGSFGPSLPLLCTIFTFFLVQTEARLLGGPRWR